jgi:hypothetical protein
MTYFLAGLSRRQFLMNAMRLVFASGIFLAGSGVHAEAKDPNFSGHYELAGAKTGRSFTLDVRQTGSRAEISFSAAMDDGSGAAPDGDGKGEVEDGILSFKFEDSFKNEGTATLQLLKDGFHLNMIVSKVIDPNPFHFYGTLRLKKTSSQPHQD